MFTLATNVYETTYEIRSIRPDDVPALQRLHSRHSEQSIYLRFFGPMKQLNKEKARYFAHVDRIDRFALVAEPASPVALWAHRSALKALSRPFRSRIADQSRRREDLDSLTR